MKKPQEFSSSLIRLHSKLNLEGTNNTIFQQAITAPLNDKQFRFEEKHKLALGIPNEINNFYELKVKFGVYERLFDLVVISLCSDIEFLFKDLFSQLLPNHNFNYGFFQRIPDVIKELESLGFDFTNYTDEVEDLKLTFQIRHIGVHNMGFVDENFKKNTKTNLPNGTKFKITQGDYDKFRNSYSRFLECLDDNLKVYKG